MTKMTFEFDLDDEDDRNEFEMHLQARSFMAAMETFDEYLRTHIRYSTDLVFTEDEVKVLEIVREKFHSLLEDHDVELHI